MIVVVLPATGQPEGETVDAARHGTLWRAALLFGGGAAGVIVALALSAACATSADAAPLPTPAGHPAADLGVVVHAATAATAPLTRPVQGVERGATGNGGQPVSPVTPVRTAVQTLTRSLTTVHRTVAPVVRTIASSIPTASSAAGPVTGGSPAATVPPGVASGPLPPLASGATAGLRTAISPRTAVPGPGRPSPPPPHHSPFPPLTANAAAEYAPTGQGGSPFGALSPTDLVLAALVLGALLLARRKHHCSSSIRGTPLLVNRSCCA